MWAILAGFLGRIVEALVDGWNDRLRQREADAAQRELGAADAARRQDEAARSAEGVAGDIRAQPAGSDDELFDRVRRPPPKP